MSTLSFDFKNDDGLDIFLYSSILFRFNNDPEHNKRQLNHEFDLLVKRMIAASDFRDTKVVPPIWLPLLCKQLDVTVPLKKGKWLDRFNQMLMEINKEIVTTKDYLFLDLK